MTIQSSSYNPNKDINDVENIRNIQKTDEKIKTGEQHDQLQKSQLSPISISLNISSPQLAPPAQIDESIKSAMDFIESVNTSIEKLIQSKHKNISDNIKETVNQQSDVEKKDSQFSNTTKKFAKAISNIDPELAKMIKSFGDIGDIFEALKEISSEMQKQSARETELTRDAQNARKESLKEQHEVLQKKMFKMRENIATAKRKKKNMTLLKWAIAGASIVAAAATGGAALLVTGALITLEMTGQFGPTGAITQALVKWGKAMGMDETDARTFATVMKWALVIIIAVGGAGLSKLMQQGAKKAGEAAVTEVVKEAAKAAAKKSVKYTAAIVTLQAMNTTGALMETVTLFVALANGTQNLFNKELRQQEAVELMREQEEGKKEGKTFAKDDLVTQGQIEKLALTPQEQIKLTDNRSTASWITMVVAFVAMSGTGFLAKGASGLTRATVVRNVVAKMGMAAQSMSTVAQSIYGAVETAKLKDLKDDEKELSKDEKELQLIIDMLAKMLESMVSNAMETLDNNKEVILEAQSSIIGSRRSMMSGLTQI